MPPDSWQPCTRYTTMKNDEEWNHWEIKVLRFFTYTVVGLALATSMMFVVFAIGLTCYTIWRFLFS
jgi:hypothetical protein